MHLVYLKNQDYSLLRLDLTMDLEKLLYHKNFGELVILQMYLENLMKDFFHKQMITRYLFFENLSLQNQFYSPQHRLSLEISSTMSKIQNLEKKYNHISFL